MSNKRAAQLPDSPPSLPQPEQGHRPAVVGIGASAGGLAAFTDFLRHMPPDSGLAFVLVQHLDPQQPSLLPELLASHTAMPVRPIVDQTPVAPNHVYLIPPNAALTIGGGVLRLEPPIEAHGQRLPIDHFFRSLAQDQGPEATGIVLSGTGSDGTEGLAAIQAAGGLTLAQTPASAGSPGMPEQTIARGVADHVLDIAAMPALLLARAGSADPGPPAAGRASDANTLHDITVLLQQSSGHDFSHYKRTTLQQRVEQRMQLLHLDSIEEYHARLHQDRDELEQLFQDLLVSVAVDAPNHIYQRRERLARPQADLPWVAAGLQATIGELNEANLDMTAANEELRSLNEELKAANEELQTSQEEIQSINEELQTVNAELSSKIEELDRANADLANLFASTQIPAIFLHGDGRIARFTPHATELFALRDSDIGRPIGDFQARFSIGDLPQQIDQVLQSHAPAELVVQRPEQDRWWSVQIRPYRTLSGAVDGVVLTFTDITALKRAEAVLQGAHDELELRVATRTAELAVANTALQTRVAERVQSEQARQLLLQQLVTAQEEERRHIARELHDQLAQDLTGLILGLKALQDSAPPGDQGAERIAQLQAVAVGIGREVRDLAVRLRPSVLDDLGLALALSNYVEQWSARANVGVDLHTSGLGGERLPLVVETTLYRLVQEALTNVLKHAHASEVSVIIERTAGEVRLIVEDDGSGFSTPPVSRELDKTPRLGLLGMQERVALLNGTLTIESASGSGTTLFARLPLAT